MKKIIKNKGVLVIMFFIFAAAGFLYLYTTNAQISPDAIALRVVPNPEHLSASKWYRSRGFEGAPQSVVVDGYRGVRDGRTVYVNAANISKNNPGPADDELHTNIYLISYNQNATANTKDIFSSILKHWRFNSNIDGTTGTCSDNDDIECVYDTDCPKSDYCLNIKARIRRDVRRLEDLEVIGGKLGDYFNKNNGYVILQSGTYIPGQSLSVWPSWQKILGRYLGGIELPVDPVNRMGNCCPASNSYCDDSFNYLPLTCWDEKKHDFAGKIPDEMPAGSLVYAYKYGSSTYELCAQLETPYANIQSFSCKEYFLVNNPPSIEGASLFGWPKQRFTGIAKAVDPDGDELSWSVSLVSPPDSAGWLAEEWTWDDGYDNFRIEPINNNEINLLAKEAGTVSLPGKYLIRLTVDDGRGQPNSTDSEEFEVSIARYKLTLTSGYTNLLVGHGPVNINMEGTDASLNPFSLTLNVREADHSRLGDIDPGALASHGLSVSGMAVEADYPGTAVQQTGLYDVLVYAVDPATGDEVEAAAEFEIYNNPPEIKSLQAKYRDDTDEICMPGEICNFMIDNKEEAVIQVSALDHDDGHGVNYELSVNPGGLSIDEFGEISGLENLFYENEFQNSASFEVRAYDDYCANSLVEECEDRMEFSISVLPYCSIASSHPAYVNAISTSSNKSFSMGNGGVATYDFMRDLGMPVPDSCSKAGNSLADIERTAINTNKAIAYVFDKSASMDGLMDVDDPCGVDWSGDFDSTEYHYCCVLQNTSMCDEVNFFTGEIDCDCIPEYPDRPFDKAKEALSDSVSSINSYMTGVTIANVYVGIADFNGRVSSGLSGRSGMFLADTPSYDNLYTYIDDIALDDRDSSYGTHTYGGLYTAYAMLRSLPVDERVIFLISDGVPDVAELRKSCGCRLDECCSSEPCVGCTIKCGSGSPPPGPSFGYNEENDDFHVALGNSPGQTDCRDDTDSCWGHLPCSDRDGCSRSCHCGSSLNECSLADDTSRLAADLKGLGYTIFSLYFNTGGTEAEQLAAADLMHNWASEPKAFHSFQASTDNIGAIVDLITSNIISKPVGVIVSDRSIPFNPAWDDDKTVTSEQLYDLGILEHLFSAVKPTTLYAEFDHSGSVIVDNIRFDYCAPYIHPPLKQCTTDAGCHEAALANAAAVSDYCESGDCYECDAGAGYSWNGSECALGCAVNCAGEAGCHYSLPNGTATGGNCCRTGYECYNCAAGYDWNDIFNVCVPSCSDTYVVNPDGSGDYTSIKEAVWDVCDGATLELSDDVFTESVIIPKDITIRSQSGNPLNTRVIGDDSYVFDVRSNGVVFENIGLSCAVSGECYGIKANGYADIEVRGSIFGFDASDTLNYGIYLRNSFGANVISDNKFNNIVKNAIYLNSGKADITDNEIDGAGSNGIMMLSADVNNISDNTIINSDVGLILINSDNNTLDSNTVTGNDQGIQLHGSRQNDIINGNYVADNTVGISLIDSASENNILNNDFANNRESGLFARASNRNVIDGNTFNNNRIEKAPGVYYGTGNGLYFTTFCFFTEILNNTINGNGNAGILMETGINGNTISGNTLDGNGRVGIMTADSDNNTYENNTISNTGSLNVINPTEDVAGVRLVNVIESTVADNILTDNQDYGVYLRVPNDGEVDNNLVSGNNITNSRIGLYVNSSFGSEFRENYIFNSIQYGININLFYNNTMVINIIDGGTSLFSSSVNNNIYQNQFDSSVFLDNGSINNNWNSLVDISYDYSLSPVNPLSGRLGNYYSENLHVDLDNNGVVDNAYALPGDYGSLPPEEDHFPLAGELSDYSF